MKEVCIPSIIAGPCAAESKQQISQIAGELQKNNVEAIRAGVWKPRTRPGFEGNGTPAMKWLNKLEPTKLVIAVEAMLPEHVTVLNENINQNTRLIIWLGSRNQNHLVQTGIARRLKDTREDTLLMIKNQPWEDFNHWLGIFDHVLSTGFPENRMFFCHRGFHSSINNSGHNSFRNTPNFEMAMRIKEETHRPVIFDPSHVGGSVDKVFQATQMALKFPFDGFMVEIHPNPQNALTDQKQQLNFKQFENWINLVRTSL